MKYFMDFILSVLRICDAGENCTRRTNIVCFLLAPDKLCFVNYDLFSGI